MKDVMLGRYIVGNSLIHRLDPRTKLISCTLIITAVLINYRWYFLLFYILLITMAIFSSGIKPKLIFRSLRKIRYLLLLTFVFQAILTTGHPLMQIGRLSVTQEGIALGTGTIFRLLIFYLCSNLLIMTTSTIKLAAGIESLLTPLTYLKIPVHHFSMIISTSLRFIPTFIEEANIITNAQKSRGAQFNSKNLITRLKSNIAIMIPLLAASLQRAEDLAMAMESRCYTGHPNQTRINKLNFNKKDVLLISFMLALLSVGVISSFI
ncbi:MAG TPA: energy-coupling factor transporter transmembrane component T [Desulfosporosinus sp.]